MIELTTTLRRDTPPSPVARNDQAPVEHDLRREHDAAAWTKRLLDVVLSSIGLCLVLPLLGIIALAVRWDGDGPVLYRQVRLGRGGRPFRILKFRTMLVDAERHTGAVWATASDPRVTPVGAFLRRTHWDELPQLINVLRGEMSLIGPRPERPEFVRELRASIPRYMERCRVLPGITGPAQLRCGYDSSLRTVRRKLRYDLFYVRRRSLPLDVAILASTVGHVASALTLRPASEPTVRSAEPRVRATAP